MLKYIVCKYILGYLWTNAMKKKAYKLFLIYTDTTFMPVLKPTTYFRNISFWTHVSAWI